MDTFITNRKETIKTLITQIKPSLPVIYFFLITILLYHYSLWNKICYDCNGHNITI